MDDREEAQYDALWADIYYSHLRQLYVEEVWRLARLVVQDVEDLLPRISRLKGDAFGGSIQVTFAREVERIVSAIEAAGRLCNFVKYRKHKVTDADGNPIPKAKTRNEIAKRRCAWLRDEVLAGVDLTELRKTGTRHAIEHFDRFLDEMGIDHYSQEEVPCVWLIDGMSGASNGAFRAMERHLNEPGNECRHLRTYNVQKTTYTHCGVSVSLGRLRTECLSIMAAVERYAPWVKPEQAQLLPMPGLTPATDRSAMHAQYEALKRSEHAAAEGG